MFFKPLTLLMLNSFRSDWFSGAKMCTNDILFCLGYDFFTVPVASSTERYLVSLVYRMQRTGGDTIHEVCSTIFPSKLVSEILNDHSEIWPTDKPSYVLRTSSLAASVCSGPITRVTRTSTPLPVVLSIDLLQTFFVKYLYVSLPTSSIKYRRHHSKK